jgi:hypothetical protein
MRFPLPEKSLLLRLHHGDVDGKGEQAVWGVLFLGKEEDELLKIKC